MNASAATKRIPGGRVWVWGVLLISLMAGAWLGLKYSSIGKRAEVGAGYVAHVVCSCRYVGNRNLPSCMTDLEPGMEIVHVEEYPQQRKVTASVPLLTSRTATYDPEYGCSLDKP